MTDKELKKLKDDLCHNQVKKRLNLFVNTL